MNQYIALFRAINVGGNNILPMRELTQSLTDAGFKEVTTYIQSGNVTFRNCEDDQTALADRIAAIVQASHGFRPQVFVLTAVQLARAAANNPFKQAELEPKTLHLFFMSHIPKQMDSAALDQLKADNETYLVIDNVLYLLAPDGIGNSKLAARIAKILGVSVTARNWRTVAKLLQMAGDS